MTSASATNLLNILFRANKSRRPKKHGNVMHASHGLVKVGVFEEGVSEDGGLEEGGGVELTQETRRKSKGGWRTELPEAPKVS